MSEALDPAAEVAALRYMIARVQENIREYGGGWADLAGTSSPVQNAQARRVYGLCSSDAAGTLRYIDQCMADLSRVIPPGVAEPQ